MRVKPTKYDVGEQTIGVSHQIDRLFPNSHLEWATKCRGVVILTGLLIKVEGEGPGTEAEQEDQDLQEY